MTRSRRRSIQPAVAGRAAWRSCPVAAWRWRTECRQAPRDTTCRCSGRCRAAPRASNCQLGPLLVEKVREIIGPQLNPADHASLSCEYEMNHTATSHREGLLPSFSAAGDQRHGFGHLHHDTQSHPPVLITATGGARDKAGTGAHSPGSLPFWFTSGRSAAWQRGRCGC